MSISSSLYSSISGLSTLGSAMSVLGDNVANVNTIAFKSSRSTFQDVLAQSVSTAAGSAQVGRGVTLSTVDGIFAQGSFESTTNPTDMAIGGQGFFMLRAADGAAADMYTRAGEFRFDQQGFLVNPVGHFVQGWNVDHASGERKGTIGDIYLGKSTPPVPTARVQAVVNLDSREPNQDPALALFDAWNGTKINNTPPEPPIDVKNYSYTSSIKVYDSQGASHDVTTYFQRTTKDNEWQFLVTCDPTEDMRVIRGTGERYDHENDQGAGALMYGTIEFSTNGAINNISAWDVPPDGKVEPALNTNRLTLRPEDTFYGFEVNFTGDDTNDRIELNLGARYDGRTREQFQVIVSEGGAYQEAGMVVDGATLLTAVYGSGENKGDPVFGEGNVISYRGFKSNGDELAEQYEIGTDATVGDLLAKLEQDFGNVTATINEAGRLQLKDGQAGESGLLVTSFQVFTDNTGAELVANPWGEQIAVTTTKQQIFADTMVSGLKATTKWEEVPFAPGDEITFRGSTGGNAPIDATYVVKASEPTVQDLLDWLEGKFNAVATIDERGRLMLTDLEVREVSKLAITGVGYDPADGAGTFGTGEFQTITPFTASGSQQGLVVTTGFRSDALASTQYANASTTLFQDQDGYASGFLQSVSVDTEGVVTGHFSNGQVLKRAQVALASFNNLAGLNKNGGNIFTQTTQSGPPVTGAPGTNGLGSIAPNSLEQSNVDLGNEFVKLITTQRGFQANSKIITTTDEMLADLINIKR